MTKQLNAAAASLNPGDPVGNFDVLEPLAAGGMGTLWKGVDRVVGRKGVIKQLSPSLTDGMSAKAADELKQRFRKEAMIQKKLSNLNHKHMVKVLDFIEHDKGLFLIMEYVDGPSLEQVLAGSGEPMDTKQALGIIAATASALEAIHSQGVLHRDLKPSNILLPNDGGLKVTDFGLASLTEDQEALSLGSARYMAPELFGNDKADQRADIYSLGLMAYEMLAGRDQFEEAFKIVLRDQRNQPLRWMKWHTNSRAAAPPLHELNPKIDEHLSELVGRMMSKDKTTRIETAKDLIRAIKRHVTGEAESSSARAAINARAKAAKAAAAVANEATAVLPQKNRLPMIIAATLVFWAVIGVSIYGYFYIKDQQHEAQKRELAQDEFDSAFQAFQGGEYEKSRAMFAGLLESWNDNTEIGKKSKVGLLWAEGEIAMSDGQYTLAKARFASVDSLGVENREKLIKRIDEAEERDAFVKQLALLDDTIARAKKLRDEGEPSGALAELATTSTPLRELAEGTRYPDEVPQVEAFAARVEALETDIELDAVLKEANAMVDDDNRGDAVAHLGTAIEDFSGNEAAQRRLQARINELTRGMRYDDFIVQAERAEANASYQAAIALLESARDIRSDPKVDQKIQELTGWVKYNEGKSFQDDGNLAKARESYEAAMTYPGPARQLAEESLARVKSMSATIGFNRSGDQAMASGRYEDAIAQYEKSLEIFDDAGIRSKMTDAKVKLIVRQANAMVTDRKVDEALDALARAAEMAPSDPAVATAIDRANQWKDYLTHLDRGNRALASKDYGGAIRQYHDAKDIFDNEEISRKIDEATFNQFVAQARDFMAQENWDAARASARTAQSIPSLTDEQRAELTAIFEIINTKKPEL